MSLRDAVDPPGARNRQAFASTGRPQAEAAALLATEKDYFEAAAENEPLCGGVLSHMPRYPSLPLGTVLHHLPARPAGRAWIVQVESRLRALGARWARVYLPGSPRPEDAALRDKGYRHGIEIGFAGPTAPRTQDMGATWLAAMHREEDWRACAALAEAAGQGPDGHGMNGHEYIDACRDKVRAGYMRGYLLIEAGHPAGCVFLSPRGPFARLKNLLIHPAHRGRGLGSRAVGLLRQEAARLGAGTLVTFAIAGSPSVPMYQAQGMREVCRQSEWVRRLD